MRFGGAEPVGHGGDEAELGVHALGQPFEGRGVTEAMIPARCL